MDGRSQARELLEGLAPISRDDVIEAYRSWAPIYDWTFGVLTRAGRRQAVARINRRGGLLLDVGVGTGLSLWGYARGVEVVGLDLSQDMLGFAQAKMRRAQPDNVMGLVRNDASAIAFANDSFDSVVAMMMLSATSDPGAVVDELIRVLKPGGELVLVNYFSHNSGWLGWAEKALAPHAARLGWRSEFPMLPFVERPELTLTMSRQIAPWNLFTLLSFRKDGPAQNEDREHVPEIGACDAPGDPGANPSIAPTPAGVPESQS
ncbi:MAG: class I SAM-dependent methyltransferase [Alphaproteobacteria bacterium]